MKKTLFSTIVLGAAAIFAVSASAQSNNNGATQQTTCNKTEQVCKQDKKDKKDRKDRDGKRDGKTRKNRQDSCRNRQACALNAFKGLNLTAQQQTAIEAIPTPASVMKAALEQAKENKTANASGTTNGAAANKPDAAKRRQMVKTVRMDYLKQVKAVLTPEQYTQFLENAFANQQTGKGLKAKADRNGNKDRKVAKNGKRDGKRDGKQNRNAKASTGTVAMN